jgi:hypothetical protein
MPPFRSSVYVTEMGESFRCAIIQSSLYVYMSVRLFVCLSVRLFVCSSVCLFVCLSVRLFVCSSVRLFVCSSVCLFVCSSVRLFVCLFRFSDVPSISQNIFPHTKKYIFFCKSNSNRKAIYKNCYLLYLKKESSIEFDI